MEGGIPSLSIQQITLHENSLGQDGWLALQHHLPFPKTILKSILLQRSKIVGARGPWLAGAQIPGSDRPDGGWTWTNGEVWLYEGWVESEPNNDCEGFDENSALFKSSDLILG